MRHLEDSFVGSGDIKLSYQVWYPDKAPKAVIQLIHGFLENGGRYIDLVNELVKRGYVAYAAVHQVKFKPKTHVRACAHKIYLEKSSLPSYISKGMKL